MIAKLLLNNHIDKLPSNRLSDLQNIKIHEPKHLDKAP